MLISICVIASFFALASYIVKRPWVSLVVGVFLWAEIAYLLFFYTGSVARHVLKPGPPSGADAGGFYVGIQQLQAELHDVYVAVIYLSMLCLCICFRNGRREKRAA